MAKISEGDLILNKDGSVYHLSLLPRHISEHIIAVGDPGRVHSISRYFDKIEFEMNKREFITHVGRFNNKRVTVISTGIGTDNVEIFMTELDALVNVDLKTREPKSRKKKLKIIRIGTTGAIQEDIPVGSHLVSEYAVGFDNLMSFYDFQMDSFEEERAAEIQEAAGLSFRPYVVRGSETLKKQFAHDMIDGNAVTTPGFYAPQGRIVRLPIKNEKLVEQLSYYHNKASNFWLTNFEMETSGYYAMGRLMGHEMLSLNAVVVNRIQDKTDRNPEKTIDALIKKVLDRI